MFKLYEQIIDSFRYKKVALWSRKKRLREKSNKSWCTSDVYAHINYLMPDNTFHAIFPRIFF